MANKIATEYEVRPFGDWLEQLRQTTPYQYARQGWVRLVEASRHASSVLACLVIIMAATLLALVLGLALTVCVLALAARQLSQQAFSLLFRRVVRMSRTAETVIK